MKEVCAVVFQMYLLYLEGPTAIFAMTGRSKSFAHKRTNEKATILGLHHIIFTFSKKLQRLNFFLQWHDISSEVHKCLLFHLILSRR